VVRHAPKPSPMRRVHVRKGDVVQVRSGNDRGKTGEVVSVDRERGRVVVKGVNLRWRHLRKSQRNPQGGRVQRESPIHASNVLLLDQKAGKGVRFRHEMREGSKVRVSTATGEILGGKT
jgi:large subunit ribosomal protein L24